MSGDDVRRRLEAYRVFERWEEGCPPSHSPEQVPMTAQEQALVAVPRFLDGAGVPYMVIGGMNIIWGEPRATLDIDVTVWVPQPDINTLIARVGASHRVLVEAPDDFVARSRVLPVQAADGIRVDIRLRAPAVRTGGDRARAA